jgi:hypothetical protein
VQQSAKAQVIQEFSKTSVPRLLTDTKVLTLRNSG